MRILLVLLAGCHTQPLDCSALQPCNAGAYKFCKQGDSCFYSLSDGNTIDCAACDSCQAAVQSVQDWCDPIGQLPDLASGPTSMSGGLVIPKTGPPYGGMHTDPGLNSLADCADATIEPNDAPATALVFTPIPDMPTAKIIKLAICPQGANPATGQHDEDWFRVDNSGGGALTLMAEILYDISYGDLDVAIVDAGGHMLSSDGTAVSNGCTTAAITGGVYYVVVTGAGNLDVNNYQALIRTFAATRSCP